MSNKKTSLYLINCLLYCFALQTSAQIFEKAPELHGDTVVFPITLINAYPFISVSVNGVAGRMMFDTGYGTSIILNDNYISLPNKKANRNGVVASGQSFIVNVNDTIGEVKFSNGLIYQNLQNIKSANFEFLQKNISPDIAGYIGHEFFKGYIFKIDYLHRKVTFYKNTTQRMSIKDFLSGEKVLAVIDFQVKKLPNHPMVKMTIDGVEVIGAFDTGQNGYLQLDDPSAKKLYSRRSVLPSGIDSGGDTLLHVKNIVFDGKLKTELKGIEMSDFNRTVITRRVSGITEPNIMSIGYRFLAQFKTVWDYEHKKIYILQY